MSRLRRLRIPHDVAELVRSLHPDLKKKIKAGLSQIQQEPGSGKPLREELAGLRSFRLGRFRIIYREASSAVLDIVAIGPRRTIYQETDRFLSRPKRGHD